MLKLIQPNINNIIKNLSNDKKLDNLLLKHLPPLSDVNIINNLIENKEPLTIVASDAISIFTNLYYALEEYRNSSDVLLFISNLDLYVLYKDGPLKLIIYGNIYQIIKPEYTQKLVLNIFDMEDRKIKLNNITIENNGEMVTEITIENRLFDNYNHAKIYYETELKSKLPKDLVDRVNLPRIRTINDIEYYKCNITTSIKNGSTKTYKNKLEYILLAKDNEETFKKKNTNNKGRSKSSIALDWIIENQPNNKENKLDYYSKYTKRVDNIVAMGTFTSLVKTLDYSLVKIKGTFVWIKNDNIETDSDDDEL